MCLGKGPGLRGPAEVAGVREEGNTCAAIQIDHAGFAAGVVAVVGRDEQDRQAGIRRPEDVVDVLEGIRQKLCAAGHSVGRGADEIKRRVPLDRDLGQVIEEEVQLVIGTDLRRLCEVVRAIGGSARQQRGDATGGRVGVVQARTRAYPAPGC